MINFKLPKALIAQEPASPRDSARLLTYNRHTQQIEDKVFSELPKYIKNDTTLVVNNSKVEKCRWLFDMGKTEIFVLEKLDSHTIKALVRPGKKFKLGQKSEITGWLTVETTAIDNDGIRTIQLNLQHDDERLQKIEHIPLPPYITQNDKIADEYQTIYAKLSKFGSSKASPTAGLHFTPKLINNIAQHHDVLEVTLHVGLGTFASLTKENIESGTLQSESYKIKDETAQKLINAKHITAVGTTTVRTLESWKNNGTLQGDTDIFIRPGYEFKSVDSMITNFHLPGTSLLLMVEAFVGSASELQRIYDHAIAQKYRFYSFGDAMLIL